MNIDYFKIAAAISHYSHLGYIELDVPWWVSRESIAATLPPGGVLYEVVDSDELRRFKDQPFGCPVGSGEQSFIEIRNRLKEAIEVGEVLGKRNGKFQCATPCFRRETYDKYHLPQFFKVELIDAFPENPDISMETMIADALGYFSQYVASPVGIGMKPEIVKTDVGFDIFLDGIELGSYGNRSVDLEGGKFWWTYGTGVAEPRLSTVIQDLGDRENWT